MSVAAVHARLEHQALQPHLRAAEVMVQTTSSRLDAANALASSNPTPATLTAARVAAVELELAVTRYRSLAKELMRLARQSAGPTN